MIIGLDGRTLMLAIIWMLLGIIIYFLYSKHNSNLNKGLE
jgi:APA family basic amino acid/polyamine antiporter